jgi:hypothetical protein
VSQRPIVSEHAPAWHRARFAEFIRAKLSVGEPSPHLAIMGYLTRAMSEADRVYALGCYAATYCLPSAQVLWTLLPRTDALREPAAVLSWVRENWAGIVTRTERRCVRSPEKMTECLLSLLAWTEADYPALKTLPPELTRANYDIAWESVSRIKFFGRYINIRFLEGLRRYCGVPARLYDIRSIGGWSPKRALCFLHPEHEAALLAEGREGDDLTDNLAMDLLLSLRENEIPEIDEYVLAAMLCEYKAAYENNKQYPGWTIDQEPLLYDKVFSYWGDRLDKNLLWEARRALFRPASLGEVTGAWHGTRWDLAKSLRTYGYVWSDVIYDYTATTDLAMPSRKTA